jgi:DNA-binding CsgD family transcriptional regulator
VNTARAHILEKLDVKNKAELTRYAAQNQLVEL